MEAAGEEEEDTEPLLCPRGLPTRLPALTGPSWCGLAQVFDKERPVQRWARERMGQGRLALTHAAGPSSHTGVLNETHRTKS